MLRMVPSSTQLKADMLKQLISTYKEKGGVSKVLGLYRDTCSLYDYAENNYAFFQTSKQGYVSVKFWQINDSTQVYDPSPQINSADVFSGNSDQMVILNAYNSNAHSYYAIYSINGFLLERKEIDTNYYEVQLPTAPGTYIVYIYYNGEVFQRRLIVR